MSSRTEAIKRKTAKAEAARKAAEARARGETSVGALVQADVREKTPEVGRPGESTERTSAVVVEVPAAEAPRKRNRPDGSSEVRPYVPEWSVLASDSIAILAPDRIKEVSGDLCRSQIFPIPLLISFTFWRSISFGLQGLSEGSLLELNFFPL